jgi:hypothetical protein
MPLPWQLIETGLVRVPSRGTGYWTLVQEFVPGSRLLRIRTVDQDEHGGQLPTTWNPVNNVPCGPDGYFPNPGCTAMLCTSAACGALIGKIGGSTGDIPDTAGGNAGPYAGKKVFAVGSDCILSLATAADGGPLFLTMNDNPSNFIHHSGELFVWLEYYPL